MTAIGRKVLAAVALLTVGLAPGCGDEEKQGSHQIWFMGSVYNGATGQILSANNGTAYEISLVSGTTTIRGTVDPNGRYTLGPLQAWNDYAVTISATDFRAFTSYNAGIAPPTPPPASQASDVYTANTTQTFDFDDCRIEVNGARANAVCSGTASFVPAVGSKTPRVESRRWTFQLARVGGRWIMERVESR